MREMLHILICPLYLVTRFFVTDIPAKLMTSDVILKHLCALSNVEPRRGGSMAGDS